MLLQKVLRIIVQSFFFFCKECGDEEALDDETFYQLHYGNSTIPKDIPIRLRKVLVRHYSIKWKWITPQDRPLPEDLDFDMTDFIDDLEDEFGLSIPEKDWPLLDGSFEDMVQYLANARQTKSHEDTGQHP